MSFDDDETTTYARAPRYEPPSLALMLRLLELLASRGQGPADDRTGNGGVR